MKYLKTLYPVILALTITGCWTPNYKKIPLQQNDIPYVLADGDYKDNQGNLHVDQHDVWAMSQADVYDYMKYIRKISAKQSETTWDKVKKIPGMLKKKHFAIFGAGTFVVLLIVVATLKRKIKKLKERIDEISADVEPESI